MAANVVLPCTDGEAKSALPNNPLAIDLRSHLVAKKRERKAKEREEKERKQRDERIV